MESPGQMHWAGTAEEGKNVPGYYGNASISSALLHTCKGCFFQPSQPCFSILISPGLKPGEGALESSLELLWNKADYKLFSVPTLPLSPVCLRAAGGSSVSLSHCHSERVCHLSLAVLSLCPAVLHLLGF